MTRREVIRTVSNLMGSAPLGIAQAVFLAAIAWRLRHLPWFLEFAGASVISGILGATLRRKRTSIQVALQYRRRLVSSGVIGALLATAVLAAFATGIQTWNLRLFEQVSGICALAGALAGSQTRGLAGQAASPGIIESSARRPKTLLFILLTLVVIFLPRYGSLDLVVFLLGYTVGVLSHWMKRELEYVAADRVRRTYELAPIGKEMMIEREWKAFEAVREGRPDEAAELVRDGSSPASLMILASVESAKGDPRKALETLQRVPSELEDKQLAKVKIQEAHLLHSIGDADRMTEALEDARRLDPKCQLASVGIEIMAEHHTSQQSLEGGKDLLRLLDTVQEARRPLHTAGEQLLSIIWKVNGSLFRTALGRVLSRMGQLSYSQEVVASAVQGSPQCPIARLHQGLIFLARRSATMSAKEQQEYADVARIAFELAIKLSPFESVTAKRARDQLNRLDRSGPTRGRGAPTSVPPLEADSRPVVSKARPAKASCVAVPIRP